MFPAWTPYTPDWTASTTNPTIGNGSIVGAYQQHGKTLRFRIFLTIGSTTSLGSGTYRFGLPSGLTSAGEQVVVGVAIDSSASARTILGGRVPDTSGTITQTVSDAVDTLVSASGPYSWATGDTITYSGTIEVA